MKLFGLIIILFFKLFSVPEVKGLNGDLVGCFQDRHALDVLNLFEIVSNHAADTADDCIAACLQKYFRYANLRNAEKCLCSSDHGDTSAGECSSVCRLNSSQPCGGVDSRSVYETGQQVPGPPGQIQMVNLTENSALLKWSPPMASNGKIANYVVTAISIESFSASVFASPRQWTYPSEVNRVRLSPLHPGSKFNLTVYAVSEHGNGIPVVTQFWTQIGEPEEPQVPTIIRRGKDEIVIKITPAKNDNGPVSAYQIVVIDESIPSPFQASQLKSWSEAQQEGLPYYVTAELSPMEVESEFTVGDGRTYGGYYNSPLAEGGDVHISLGVISSKDGVRKASYAHATHEQHGIIILDVATPPGSQPTSALVVGLSVAIAVFGFLLFLSILAFFGLRHHVQQRRRRMPDHQELSLQGPMVEVETNGFVHSGYIPEESDERVNHYEKLKQQVWNIPRNFVDVRQELLGQGRYGQVKRGTVQLRGFPVPVAIHTIADTNLIAQDKKAMLRDLDVLIKAGKHDNIITLIGTCENPELLFVVIEHHPASLKDVLLESRVLEHTPPEQRQQLARFCSLSEHHLLGVALDVAHGMQYLANRKIVHKQLSARNILMADGLTPKISGYGIADFNRIHDKPQDFTRWTAQEIFRSRHYVSKSDVWSYGCLLWEIAALGGTPYNEVLTREVPARVMRGLILSQPQHVSDDLYQLMLQCWQVDLDERPTFPEMSQILENLMENPLLHLNFNVYPGFHYEQFVSDAEKLS